MSEPASEEATADGSVHDSLLASLQEHLGEAVLASETHGGDLWVRVETAAWRQAAQVCRDQLAMDYFCFLSGLDWKHNPDLSGEKIWDPSGAIVVDSDAEPGAEQETDGGGGYQTGLAGGETRFQLLARVHSTTRKVGITLKADVDEQDPRADSWVEVYRGADWHERETWEMFGFLFDGHPSLRHIYLPGEFEGHPLRKDFPVLAREVKPWPGLVDVEPMPGEEDEAEDASDTAGTAEASD